MRLRVRYRKQGRLRFIGAIDVGRVWERALRRADLPIAYSEGFSPHPKVSFTDALPLGYAGRQAMGLGKRLGGKPAEAVAKHLTSGSPAARTSAIARGKS